MAQITHYPLVSHVRGQASGQTLYWKGGRLQRNGRGLSFFFRALNANLAEVPLDDRELPFLFHGRTPTSRTSSVQGVVTYRVVEPGRARRPHRLRHRPRGRPCTRAAARPARAAA